MIEGRLCVDLNEMLDDEHVLLSVHDETIDSCGNVISLHDGLEIKFWSDDGDENGNEDNLIGDAVGVPNPHFGTKHGWGHVKWCCRITSLAHESEMGEDFQRDWRRVRCGSYIDVFWLAETLPIKNALHFCDGRSYSLDVRYFPQPHIKHGEWFNLVDFYRTERDYVSHISISKRHMLPCGNIVCVGEGSYGADGLIALLDQKERLKWVLFSDASSPFISIVEKNAHTVWVESSADYWLEIDINNPVALTIREL